MSFTFTSSISSYFSFFSFYCFFYLFSTYGVGFSFSSDIEFTVSKLQLICFTSSSFNAKNSIVYAYLLSELNADMLVHNSSNCLPSIPLYSFFLSFWTKAAYFYGSSVAFRLIYWISFICVSTNSSTSLLNFIRHSSYLFNAFSNYSEGFLYLSTLLMSYLKEIELSLSPWKCLA